MYYKPLEHNLLSVASSYNTVPWCNWLLDEIDIVLGCQILYQELYLWINLPITLAKFNTVSPSAPGISELSNDKIPFCNGNVLWSIRLSIHSTIWILKYLRISNSGSSGKSYMTVLGKAFDQNAITGSTWQTGLTIPTHRQRMSSWWM